MLAVLIVFFCSTASTLSVSAEEVTPSNTYDTAYFQSLFERNGYDTTRQNLANLAPANYVVVMFVDKTVISDVDFQYYFIPKTTMDNFYLSGSYDNQEYLLNAISNVESANYPILTCSNGGIGYTYGEATVEVLQSTNTLNWLRARPTQDYYNDIITKYDILTSVGNKTNNPNNLYRAITIHTDTNAKKYYEYYISDPSLYNICVDTGFFNTDPIENHISESYPKSSIYYAPNMFASLASIFGGYTGEILDTSVAGLIKDKGIDAPSTIYDNYKNKLYYFQNNDLSMVFMNNAEAPSYKKEDYNGIYEDAKKYTFTYAKTYDVIVFFPQYQKYLKFDDWWNANAKGGIDWGAWGNLGIIDVIISTNDKSKTFYLTSDWDVTFNDTGGAAYSGTRVIMSWDSEYGETLDSNTMMKPWEDNSETLKNQGWQEGRPYDMNYPFCIDYYMNGMPTTRIYLNSKPKVEVERISDTKCSYKICMLGTYGYFYDVLSDMYCSFDFTVNYDIENPYGLTFVDIYNDYLEAIHINYVSLGDEFQLELWENYKGNDTYYTGTQVFFNWDIRTNWYNSLRDDTFDYNKIIRDSIGGYVDNNGNQHGGNLSDYADSDLNKNNDNGNKQENNSTPSADGFQFTSEGIFAYCGEFFSFIKYIFDLFPAWIWLIIGTFITVLIMLRVLGR